MIPRRVWISLPILGALIAVLCFALAQLPRRARRVSPAPSGPPPEELAGPASPRPAGPLRFIIAGGGPSPELNQVQIEQDVALAREIFAPSGTGLVLFAGGPGSRAVQELSDGEPDELALELAAILDPRSGRDAHYRETTLAPDGAATAEATLAALEGAITDGEMPLTVYLAGHGHGGETPAESAFLTWSEGDLWVDDLTRVLDAAPAHRPVRFVITSCYSGGFAEIAFEGADPERGPAGTDRCGLFATSFDRPAAGCDPNPDRGAQEGYGIHFLHALRGEDRDGRPIARREIDLDADGSISLLEAHTRARIVSGSIDVPTTTSERFLRAVATERAGRLPPGALPEERAVIEGLRARLELARAEDARPRLARLNARLDEVAGELDRVGEELGAAEERLAAALLHRWPLLEDPWHPGFADSLASARADLATFLADSADAAQRAVLLAEEQRLSDEHGRLMVEVAPYARLVAALDTLELAAGLRAEGGRMWLRYEAFLACERGAP